MVIKTLKVSKFRTILYNKKKIAKALIIFKIQVAEIQDNLFS